MSESTITFNGVQYTVNWDDDRNDNPDQCDAPVYPRADAGMLGFCHPWLPHHLVLLRWLHLLQARSDEGLGL